MEKEARAHCASNIYHRLHSQIYPITRLQPEQERAAMDRDFLLWPLQSPPRQMHAPANG